MNPSLAPSSAPPRDRRPTALAQAGRARVAYMLALGLLGVLTIVGQVVVQRVLAGQDRSAEITNVSGRQRMLSQRMTVAALRLAHEAGAAREAVAVGLSTDLATLRTNHERLLRGDLDAFAAASDRAALAELDATQFALTRAVGVSLDRTSADGSPAVVESAERFLLVMDRSVNAYSTAAAAGIAWTRVVELSLGLLTLLVLVIEALLVFRPLGRQLEASIEAEAELTARLLRSEARYGRAVRGARDGLWEWTPDDESLYWSPRFYELLGLEEDVEPSWDRLVALAVDADRDSLTDALRAEDDEPLDVEFRVETENGPRWRSLRGRAGSGRIAGTFADVDPRRRLEAERERLLQSQAADLAHARYHLSRIQLQSAVGSLAAGIAHDFNNYLQVIQTAAEAVLDDADPEEEARAVLEASREASSLASQLLALGRQPTGAMSSTPVDIATLLDSFRPLLERTLPEKVILEVDIPSGLHPVYGEPMQLRQALLNLCVNARDAMPHGGHLRLAVRPRTHDGHDGLELTVEDEGVGMSLPVQQRAFEPFFTTKALGKGTGLGLAMVEATVQRHGGRVVLQSAVGNGTVVRVWLPAAHEEAGGSASGPAPTKSTVLLIDDDQALRRGLERTLTRRGHHVVSADSGRAAESVANELEEPPDLVVCDIMLTDQLGTDIVTRLRQRWGAQLPVVFISGYTQVEVDTTLPATAFVQKPFHQTELDRAMAKVSAGRPGEPEHAS